MNELQIGNDQEKGMNSFGNFLIILLLMIVFFIASAYGVQRTILSAFTKQTLPVAEWFTGWGWISIAFTLSSFGLFKGTAGIFSGEITNKLGLNKVVILGTSCFALGSIILLLTQGRFIIISLGNSFLGTGEGILYAAAMTYLTEISKPSRRAQWLGIMELSVYGGYSFGALTSGTISMISGSTGASFIFSALISLLAVGFALLTIKPITKSSTQVEFEKLRTPIEDFQPSRSIGSLIQKPTVFVTLLTGHTSKMVDSIIVLYLPLILNSSYYGYGLSLEETGVITASFTFFWAITMPLAGRISDKIGRKTPVIFGLILQALLLIIFSLANFPSIFLLFNIALAGFAIGLYYPILPTISADIASDVDKPRLIGLYRSFKDLGYFTGPIFAGFVAQLWFDEGLSLNIVIRIPILVSGVILFICGFIIILARETHPGWSQFRSSLEHAELVEECIVQSTNGLLVYLEQLVESDEDYQYRLIRYSQKAKELEIIADRKLQEIVVETYKTLHKTPDSENFLRIARRLDRVGGLTLGALFRIQMLSINDIPPLIQEKLHNAAIALRSMVRSTVDVLKVLEIKIDAVEGIYHTVQAREHDLDLLYQAMNRQLYISATQMHFGVFSAIKDVVNMIEQAADSAEDAAEVINILSIKYHA